MMIHSYVRVSTLLAKSHFLNIHKKKPPHFSFVHEFCVWSSFLFLFHFQASQSELIFPTDFQFFMAYQIYWATRFAYFLASNYMPVCYHHRRSKAHTERIHRRGIAERERENFNPFFLLSHFDFWWKYFRYVLPFFRNHILTFYYIPKNFLFSLPRCIYLWSDLMGIWRVKIFLFFFAFPLSHFLIIFDYFKYIFKNYFHTLGWLFRPQLLWY